ncbi:hypothetical protein BGX27_007260, partial [Mortierella sp. AM989]
RLEECQMTKKEAADLAEEYSAMKEIKEGEVKILKKLVAANEKIREEAAQNLSLGDVHGYETLRQARIDVRKSRKELQPQEKSLNFLKKSIYELNKMSKAPRGITNSPAELTVATWDQPAVTESTERLDISPLFNTTTNCRGKSRLV